MTEADRRSGFYGGGSVGFTKVRGDLRAAGELAGLVLTGQSGTRRHD